MAQDTATSESATTAERHTSCEGCWKVNKHICGACRDYNEHETAEESSTRWDWQHAEDVRKKAEAQATRTVLVGLIGVALGDGWRPGCRAGMERDNPYEYLTHDAEGLMLSFPLDSYPHKSGRIEVHAWAYEADSSGRWVNGSDCYGRNERKPPTMITMDARKTAVQMAREIERRLLPGYREMIARIRGRVAEHNDGRALTVSTAKQIADAIGIEAPGADKIRDGAITMFPSSQIESVYMITVHGESIDIRITSAKVDEATRALCQLDGARHLPPLPNPDAMIQYAPCGEAECDGTTGEDHDPEYYCAGGHPWTEHTIISEE